ncbi:MAG: hypoxanthine phosphoribosyltransferase [Deltaproteobacteria bacterium]|nr:hypoxanthine phosphoribosyltransferase [Deltaproteobacteria bacterium]
MDKLTLLYSRQAIAERVRALAEAINSDYADKELVLVGILRGTFVFLADLIRLIKVPVTVDFIGVSSYGLGTESSQQIALTKDVQIPVTGKHVLVVEDILDTGLTVDFVLRSLRQRQPASLRVCALIDKKERRLIDVPVDYVGFDLKSGFVAGYGIDCAERYRSLPDIYLVESVER